MDVIDCKITSGVEYCTQRNSTYFILCGFWGSCV